jgi:hypothetical protein
MFMEVPPRPLRLVRSGQFSYAAASQPELENLRMLVSIDLVAQAAEIVAAVGVIISLFYVGVQIRHSTRATKLAAVQAVEEAIARTEQMIIQDRGFAELVMRGLTATGGELPDADRLRINVFYRHHLRAYQSAYYQFEHSALDAAVWAGHAKAMAAIFQADRGLREHFAVEKYMFEPTFVAFCEKLLRETDHLALTSDVNPAGPKPTALRRSPQRQYRSNRGRVITASSPAGLCD